MCDSGHMPGDAVFKLAINPCIPACIKQGMLTGSVNQVNVGFMTVDAGIPAPDAV
jgi:hypothetical protein